MIPVINYPSGAGGRWLSYVVYCLENACELVYNAPGANFHAFKESKSIKAIHADGRPYDYVFCGKGEFNMYLNYWQKLLRSDNYKGFNELSYDQIIFELSDHAAWRMSPEYAAEFVVAADIEYSNIFYNTTLLRTQILHVLESTEIDADRVTQQFVNDAAELFKVTAVPVDDHISNKSSRPWQGWCHALALANNIEVPFTISNDKESEFEDWLTDYNDLFVKLTQEYII